MKSLCVLFIPALFFVTSCQEENDITTKEAVQFSLDVTRGNSRTSADLPENISVEMTLASGDEEITKSVAFTKTGDSYISEWVDMPRGSYELKDFVVDSEDLAAVPGLPQNFSVDGDEQKNISIGRVASHYNGAQPLLIAVYTEGAKTELTNAKVTIFEHERGRYVYDRSGKIHQVVFKGNPNAWYTLKIEKEGYEVYSLTFTYSDLSKKRLAITLQEESTEDAITFQPNATSLEVWILFTGKGTIVLDWGTGDVETIDFDVDPENVSSTGFVVREQGYAIAMPPAKITGDIHLVTGLWFTSGIDAVNLEHAPAFNNLSIRDSRMPLLDLRFNNQLNHLEINNSIIDELLLPVQHDLSNFSIEPVTDGTVWPSISDLDYIINNIHVNAVAKNIREGRISLGGAAVSEQSAAKLAELENSYAWWILD